MGSCPLCGERDPDRIIIWFTPEDRAEAQRRGIAFAASHLGCRRRELDSSGRSVECPCMDCRRGRGEQIQQSDAPGRAARPGDAELRRNRGIVLERDSWICQICYLDISHEAYVHDDLAPTVDHIIPRRDGGGDDLDNLRAVHRWCNIRREHPYFGGDQDIFYDARVRFGIKDIDQGL